jgi:hypothetical protein
MPKVARFPLFSHLVFMLGIAVLLGGCASRPKVVTPEEQAEKLATILSNGGYISAGKLEINSVHEVWRHDNAELDVVMTAPTSPGNYPLIIYLPSLGEKANAGHLWREAWAKAGYAVFSVQPMSIGQALKELRSEGGQAKNEDEETDDIDAEPKPAPEEKSWFSRDKKPKRGNDRAGEIRYLGHEYFALDNLKNRMEQLFWAYQQLRSRADLHLPLYSAANFSKVILVGYDLGAQTVAAIIGEDFKAKLPTNAELKPYAAITLSPSIDLAEGNIRNRFQKLNLPLLVITGNDDNDPYAISSASVREVMWEFSPPGNKYLLLLNGVVHALLAGVDMGGGPSVAGPTERDGPAGGRGGNGDRSFTEQFQTTNQYGSGGGGRGHGGAGVGNIPSGEGKDKGKDAELKYKQVAAVLSTSTAFLDIVTKNDEFALYWMQEKAHKWLDRAGSLDLR